MTASWIEHNERGEIIRAELRAERRDASARCVDDGPATPWEIGRGVRALTTVERAQALDAAGVTEASPEDIGRLLAAYSPEARRLALRVAGVDPPPPVPPATPEEIGEVLAGLGSVELTRVMRAAGIAELHFTRPPEQLRVPAEPARDDLRVRLEAAERARDAAIRNADAAIALAREALQATRKPVELAPGSGPHGPQAVLEGDGCRVALFDGPLGPAIIRAIPPHGPAVDVYLSDVLWLAQQAGALP